MIVSAILPNAGPLTREPGIKAMAEAAVAAGTAGLWVSDHLVLHADPPTGYPYSGDGQITWDQHEAYFESLSTCAYVAGLVDGACTVGTAVLVLPQRNVIQTAKEIATIDQLSGGRLRLGLGAGWNEAEMEALGYDFPTRGTRLTEMVQVLRDAWTGRTSHFQGQTLEVPGDLVLAPTPVRPEGPALLVGGMTPPAMRRAANIGDGWLAIAFVDKWDREALAAATEKFRSAWSANRPAEPSSQAVLKLHCRAPLWTELPRRVEEVAEMGFDEVIVDLPWESSVDTASDLLRELVAAHSTS